MTRWKPLFASALLSSTPAVLANGTNCAKWSKAEIMGTLDQDALPEASGLVVSKQFDNRLYHLNDSGDNGHIITTTKQGETVQVSRIAGMDAVDTEDLGYGWCTTEKLARCLFMADIGDNHEERKTVSVTIVAEKEQMAETENPLKTVTLC